MSWYVVDGMDGSGKSTTAYALKDILESRGRTVMVMDHPTRNTRSGRIAVRYLQNDGRSSMICATGFFIINVLGSLFKMKRTKDVDDFIFVRYTLSVAYLPERLVPFAYKVVTAVLPKPDIKIFKDVDIQDAYGRIRSRGEDIEMFESMEALTKTKNKMILMTDDWHVVNSEFTPDEVTDDLLRIVDPI